MVKYSRREVLIGGGAAFGAAVVGAAALAPEAAQAALTYDPSSKTANISQYGNPTQFVSLYPSTNKNVMQQVVIFNSNAWQTQSETGSASNYYTTVISRYQGPSYSSTKNPELDHMRIYDAGHGLGLFFEKSGSDIYVWASLQGQNDQSAPRGGILSRFKYTAGDYHLSKIPSGIQFMRQFPNLYGELQEEIYSFDSARGYVVCRQFDFHTGTRELVTRRKLSDVKAGVDQAYGQFYVPANPPTLQGFTTINDTLFRWIGKGNSATPGQVTPGDPMAIEQWDWNTGQKIGYKEFPTLAQTNSTPGQLWRDGIYEPEGCSVYREADGTASLIVGVTVGKSGDHFWPVYKFSNIGIA